MLKIDCLKLIAGNWLLEIDCWRLITGNLLLTPADTLMTPTDTFLSLKPQNWVFKNWFYKNWVYKNWVYKNLVYKNWFYINWAYKNWVFKNGVYKNWDYKSWVGKNWVYKNQVLTMAFCLKGKSWKPLQKKALKPPWQRRRGMGGGEGEATAISSNLFWSFYPHRSRGLVSPVCGNFLVWGYHVFGFTVTR